MNADLTMYRHEIEKQVKSESQKEAWIDFSSVKEKYNELKIIAEPLMRKKKHNLEEMQQIQDYIILCLTSGIFIPPRRSKDFCDFKIKNILLDGKRIKLQVSIHRDDFSLPSFLNRCY
jgi:hypothetical protein